MEFIKEFFQFLRERKKYWLIPLILMMIALGAVLVFAQGSPVLPFIYTIF